MISALLLLVSFPASAFLHPMIAAPPRRTRTLADRQNGFLFSVASTDKTTTHQVEGRGSGKTHDAKEKVDNELSNRSMQELKNELLDLLAHMTGQEHEFRRVEQLVNVMEDRYMPAQTLGFLNLALEGSWQLLFSTNMSGTPNPQKFRLRELVQTIHTNQRTGQIDNTAAWDLAEAGDGQFLCHGSFTVTCPYQINQGARCVIQQDMTNHPVLRPAPGSPIPHDVPALVGLLHRSLPKSLLDPREHAVDTTYCDADLRIVRYTGPRLEGVRDIFQRRGVLGENSDEKNNHPQEKENE